MAQARLLRRTCSSPWHAGNAVDLTKYAARNARALEDVENELGESEVFDEGERPCYTLLRT